MVWRRWAGVLGCSLIAGCAQRAALGQEAVNIVPRVAAKTAATAPAAIRVDSALVLIPVHVTTAAGASVTSLDRDNFRLFDDNEEQTISVFAHDDAPISVGLLFDASGSMKNKRQKIAEAAASFFKFSNKEDEFFLIEFSDRPKLAVPFTSDVGAIYSKIVATKPYGRTALLDAVQRALRQMKGARHLRKALVILSDGGDNWSRHKAREIESALLESDVQVYAMGIFDADLDTHHPAEEREGPRLLKDLTEQSGGRLYPVSDIAGLPAISERISRELRNQYLLGFTPTHPPLEGKYRKVQVKLAPPRGMPELRAYYRAGYYGIE